MCQISLKCKVIRIETPRGLRFFCNFGKKNRVQTAWSLAGAHSFFDPFVLNDTLTKLRAAKKKCSVYEVECHSEPFDFDSYITELKRKKPYDPSKLAPYYVKEA